MAIDAVVFDLGKVLLDFDYGIAAAKLAQRCKISSPEILKLIAQPPLLFKYETGLMSQEQFYQEICRVTGFCGDMVEFTGFFSDIFSPIPRMIELQADLRKRGLPTYIFSNTNDLAITHIRKHFPFFHNFDGYILSYEHGSMKPDARLYEVVEEMSKQRGKSILYLDDREENVAAGAERGWQVILQENPDKTLGHLRSLGLV
jgi:HAD superfamily hydrolase (TIGR01509 family)